MRTTTAVVKLTLRKNKTLADGTHPIMLRVSFGGMKEKSTGFSATERQWDEKNGQLRKNYPNWQDVNAILRQQKEQALKARDKLSADGTIPTPEAIISAAFEKPSQTKKRDLQSLVQEYIDKNPSLSERTIAVWKATANHLRVFNHRATIDSMDDAEVQRFAEYLKKTCSDGTIRLYLSKVAALLHWCTDSGIIQRYPIRQKHCRAYPASKSELYICKETMGILFRLYYDAVLGKDGKLMEGHPNHKEYSLYLFLLGYHMKGLAPVDMTNIRKQDIKKTGSTYIVSGRRQKTKQPFKFALCIDDKATDVLVTQMMDYSPSEYLVDMDAFSFTRVRRRRELREWFAEANELIRKENLKTEPIDMNCTYYTYRHSYLMAALQQPDANWLRIATEMGKSPTTLYQYISEIENSQLI